MAWLIASGGAMAASTMSISSPDFAPGQPIPAKYAKANQNISPALQLKNVPEAAKSLVLIVDDPDAPQDGPNAFTHWLVWNIDPHHTQFLEGRAPRGAEQGKNSNGDLHYDGPAPPSGTHHYFFHLYALDMKPALAAGADRAAVTAAVKGHTVAEADLVGTFAAK